MKHNFSEQTKELFFWNKKCWWCGQLHANCLHHIMGRVSSSPLNAAPLSNFECHIGNGKLTQISNRCMLLSKTLDYLICNNYKFTNNDIEFITKHKRVYSYNGPLHITQNVV